ncbi:hypothetical protein U3516DRAFT_753138 [Neocallimastix sp. 'constans']
MMLLDLALLLGLYAWIYINCTWDPYQNTGNLPIAIVNKDKGASILDSNINMGNKKVRDSDVYGKIGFPENFSQQLNSVFNTGEIIKPQLDFTINHKKNPVTPIIVNKAVSTIKDNINQSIVNRIILKALETIEDKDLLNKKTHPTLDSLTDTTKDGILNIQGAMDSMKGLSVVMDNSITSLETEGSNIMHSINLDPQRENAEIISNKIDEVDAFLSDEKTKSSENSKFGTYKGNCSTLPIPFLFSSEYEICKPEIINSPSIDVIHEIYNSKFDENRAVYKLNNSNDNLLACIMIFNFAYIFCNSDVSDNSDITNNEFDEKLMVCLQHKIITDEYGNKQDILKLNYEYVNNNLNKWHIEESNDSKFYSIISTYDDKCLNYSGNTLYMQECKNNNNYQEFTIKDDIIYSRIDELNATLTKILEFNMWMKIGNWGIENGKLCGIGYERYSWVCVCKEDGQWCGIGELVYDNSIRIKNKKTQECLITNLLSDTNVLLMSDCNHHVWTYQNEQLVLDATGKMLICIEFRKY